MCFPLLSLKGQLKQGPLCRAQGGRDRVLSPPVHCTPLWCCLNAFHVHTLLIQRNKYEAFPQLCSKKVTVSHTFPQQLRRLMQLIHALYISPSGLSISVIPLPPSSFPFEPGMGCDTSHFIIFRSAVPSGFQPVGRLSVELPEIYI